MNSCRRACSALADGFSTILGNYPVNSSYKHRTKVHKPLHLISQALANGRPIVHGRQSHNAIDLGRQGHLHRVKGTQDHWVVL